MTTAATPVPAFAASAHYLGEAGRSYFAYADAGGTQRGRINARKFAPFVRPDDRVLDFGCGGGSLLAQLDCRQRLGVEINPAAHEAARALGIELHSTCATVPAGSVDLVISNHALEHVPAPLDTLRQLHDKLVPAGRFALCVPLDDWRTQTCFTAPDINRHLYTWTPKLLGNLLTEAGFRVQRAWVLEHAWPEKHWSWLDRRLSPRAFDLVCRFTAWRLKRRQVMAIGDRA